MGIHLWVLLRPSVAGMRVMIEGTTMSDGSIKTRRRPEELNAGVFGVGRK